MTLEVGALLLLIAVYIVVRFFLNPWHHMSKMNGIILLKGSERLLYEMVEDKLKQPKNKNLSKELATISVLSDAVALLYLAKAKHDLEPVLVNKKDEIVLRLDLLN